MQNDNMQIQNRVWKIYLSAKLVAQRNKMLN